MSYVYIRRYSNVCAHVCECMCVYVGMRTYMYMYMYVNMYMYIYIYICHPAGWRASNVFPTSDRPGARCLGCHPPGGWLLLPGWMALEPSRIAGCPMQLVRSLQRSATLAHVQNREDPQIQVRLQKPQRASSDLLSSSEVSSLQVAAETVT